jgi:hypothetical protein
MTFSQCWPPLLILICLSVIVAAPASAFVANSLDITINKNGDATALFSFTLEGFIENAIPQSMLEDELKKGLTTSSEPPVLVSVDRASATIVMKKFADTADVPTGTEYRTASMDFTKAQIALENSALSSVITADFSPKQISLTFPDGFKRVFTDINALPSVTHTVIDPEKAAALNATATTGTIKVTSSPSGAEVLIDDVLAGYSPGTFAEIPPGSHIVTIRKEGFNPSIRTVSVKAGSTTEVTGLLTYGAPIPLPTRAGFHPLPGFGSLLVIVALAGLTITLSRKSR